MLCMCLCPILIYSVSPYTCHSKKTVFVVLAVVLKNKEGASWGQGCRFNNKHNQNLVKPTNQQQQQQQKKHICSCSDCSAMFERGLAPNQTQSVEYMLQLSILMNFIHSLLNIYL